MSGPVPSAFDKAENGSVGNLELAVLDGDLLALGNLDVFVSHDFPPFCMQRMLSVFKS